MITLHGLSFDTVAVLIKMIYTEELKLTENCTIRDAILAADYLRMEGVLESLIASAKRNITPENVLDLIRLHEKLDETLIKKCVQFLSLHTGLVNDQIHGLNFGQLLVIAKHYPVEETTTNGYYGQTPPFNYDYSLRPNIPMPPTQLLELIVAWTTGVDNETPGNDRYQHVSELLSAVTISAPLPVGYLAD